MSGDDGSPGRPVEHAQVEVVRANWDAEFTAFVVAGGPALARTAWLLCGDYHRAEELTQQALVRTYGAWGTARQGEPLAYARRVLANARIDSWRGRRREVLTAPESLPEPKPPQVPGEDPRRDEVVVALHALPVKRRRVVVLRYVVGMSEAEVADTLGISVGTVKSAGSRGLVQLRQALAAIPEVGAGAEGRSVL